MPSPHADWFVDHAEIPLLLLHVDCYSLFPGPGPARYKMPSMTGFESHDCRRRTWPAFSFGRRIGSCKYGWVYVSIAKHTRASTACTTYSVVVISSMQLHILLEWIWLCVLHIYGAIELSHSHHSICSSCHPSPLLHPHVGFGKSDTPGPGYFIDSTMTRTGKDGTPHYSLYGRHKDLGRMNRSCDKV